MRRLILLVATVLLVSATAQGQGVGFTGEWEQHQIQVLEPTDQTSFRGKPRIAALVIAMRSLGEPSDTDFECFNFYDDFFIGPDEEWVGFIVATTHWNPPALHGVFD